MKPKVYYIEDSEKDYLQLRALLQKRGFTVYPANLDQWSKELSDLGLYLQNPNDKQKIVVENILSSYQVDVFIIDILIEGISTGGSDIYEQILTGEAFRGKKFVFISSETNRGATIPFGPGFDSVQKGNHEEGFNYDRIASELEAKLRTLLGQKPGFWRRLSNWFRGMEDAI